MQMKSEFEMLVNRLGLSDEEQSLAAIVWSKCEKTMTGKGQDAILLGGEVFNFETRNTVILHNVELITNEDIDFMIHMNRQILTGFEEVKKLLNRSIQEEWLQCDPDNPNTLPAFESLNELKKFKRGIKHRANRLANIQRKFKKVKGTL